MNEVLDPLAKIPGVRLALLVTPDGVPVCVRGEHADRSRDGAESNDDVESLSAIAAGWLFDVARSIAPLSWQAPERAVLRASRGTLVLLAVPGAVLLVTCDRGTSPDELRLPMNGALQRMQRVLRSMNQRQRGAGIAADAPAQANACDSPLPSRPSDKGREASTTDSTAVSSSLSARQN